MNEHGLCVDYSIKDFLPAMKSGVYNGFMSIDITAIIGNISQSLQPVQHLVAGLAYMTGIIFFITGLKQLHSTSRSSSGEGLLAAMIYFVVGAMLVYLPTALNVLSSTVFGDDNVLEYATQHPSRLIQSLTVLIQTAGLIWFVKGCVFLVSAKESQGKGIYKSITFIISGILAMNFKATMTTIGTFASYLVSLSLTIKSALGF